MLRLRGDSIVSALSDSGVVVVGSDRCKATGGDEVCMDAARGFVAEMNAFFRKTKSYREDTALRNIRVR
jgi:hypothetical protein